MLAKRMLIPGEDPRELLDFYQAMRREFEPRTALEEELLDQLVDAAWRRRRIERLEAATWAEGGDMKKAYCRNCQTSAASPAKPGGLP